MSASGNLQMVNAPKLRPYQQNAIDTIRKKIACGKKRILLVLATGAGKTSVAAEIIRLAKEKNKKTLFIAHRQELIYQAHSRFANIGIDTGIIMAGHKTNGHDIHVASIQTLIRREHPPADIIFVDECHRIAGKSYTTALANYPDAVHIGLTATPYRSDSKPLGEFFDAIVAPVTMQELIKDGFLVQPRYFGAKQDFSKIKIKMGDYDNRQMFDYVDKKVLYDGVVEKFKQFGHGKTLVFCLNIEHSKKTCEAFMSAGYKAIHLDCDTDTSTRKRILKEFAAGEWQILINVALFCEGFDLPAINTIIINRATKAKGLFFQIVGRGLRPHGGKNGCIIIDHGNNVYEHGKVEWAQEYSLEVIKKKKQISDTYEDPVKPCPECSSLIHPRIMICPDCGYEFPATQKIVEAEFEEIITPKIVIPARLRKRWADMSDEELEEYRVLKNYKKKWVFHQKRLRIEEELKKTRSENVLFCKKCNISFDSVQVIKQVIDLPNDGYHIKASCPKCNSYIKFLPHKENTI